MHSFIQFSIISTKTNAKTAKDQTKKLCSMPMQILTSHFLLFILDQIVIVTLTITIMPDSVEGYFENILNLYTISYSRCVTNLKIKFTLTLTANVLNLKLELQWIKKGNDAISVYFQRIKAARDKLSAVGGQIGINH